MVSDQWAPAATPTSTPSPSTTPAVGETGTPTATDDQKGIAAVAYILLWVTGLIIFFVAKKEQRYARWNAVQAIGLGIVLFALNIVLSVVTTAMAFGGAGAVAMAGIMTLLSFGLMVGGLILVVLTAVKAYQGAPMRLPVLAEFADKYA